MRSNLWASGYDVDGTDQTSLGQFSGRVQQTYKHSVPRFFVPEHGTMFTLALVRFPPTATKEIQYLNAKGALTYTDIAGDPVLYGNLPPREISMKDRSEERFSRNAETDLVCRFLLHLHSFPTRRSSDLYKHSVPRFFVPEHGTMFTLALVRFPPTATKEIQYLNAKGALTYTDIAGDPVLYGNLPPREISMKD